jgi:AICAR transformylase/IMP cyclohydrolase PurH
VGVDALDAYRKALACDPVSAFGSVIAFTVPVDDVAAEAISALFVECVVAPAFTAGAVEVLGRKKNLRVLEGSPDAGRGRRASTTSACGAASSPRNGRCRPPSPAGGAR